MKNALFLSIPLVSAFALASCNTPVEEVALEENCRTRAERTGDPNQLFYCPESFEGPLEPPAPDEGYQLHYGPREQTAPEEEMCLTVQTEQEAEILVRQYEGRMRPGSHHFLLYKTDIDLPDGVYYPCFAGYPHDGVESVPEFAEAGVTQFTSGRLTWLAGLQAPGNLATPNYEDQGMAMKLPAKAQLILNVHYVNVTDEPITQEVWVNAYYAEDKSNIKEEIGFITWIGVPIRIPPETDGYRQSYLAFLPEDHMDDYEAETGKKLDSLRLYLLTGHAHDLLKDMNVVIERADGTEEEVYYTDSWYEPEYTFYEDPIIVNRGDRIRYTCWYDNWTDEYVEFGETTDEEMCNIFGVYAPGLGGNWLNATVID